MVDVNEINELAFQIFLAMRYLKYWQLLCIRLKRPPYDFSSQAILSHCFSLFL